MNALSDPQALMEAFAAFTSASEQLQQRYDARPGTVYLIRPDQHVAGRWRSFDAARIEAALARACGH